MSKSKWLIPKLAMALALLGVVAIPAQSAGAATSTAPTLALKILLIGGPPTSGTPDVTTAAWAAALTTEGVPFTEVDGVGAYGSETVTLPALTTSATVGNFNGVVLADTDAGFAAGALGVEAYFKWLEKTEQKYHDLVAAAQKVNDAMREITASGKTADESFVEMQQPMAKAREEGRGLAADMENDAKLADAMKEAFDASADRIAAVHKDTADLNSKLVDLLVATGRISPERGKVMDLEIQHAQKLQEFADARAKAQGDVSQAQSALGQARQDFQAAGGGDDFHDQGFFNNKQFSDEHAARLEHIITGYEKVKNAEDAASRAAASDALTHSLDFGAFATVDFERMYGGFDTTRSKLFPATGGSIINISSVNALRGISLVAYTAAKGGIVSLTKVLALQYGAARLSANATALIMLSEVVVASASSIALGAGELNPRTLLGGSLIVLAALMAARAGNQEA